MPHSPVWDLGMGPCTQVSLHPNIKGGGCDRQWYTVFRHRVSGPELATTRTHSTWWSQNPYMPYCEMWKCCLPQETKTSLESGPNIIILFWVQSTWLSISCRHVIVCRGTWDSYSVTRISEPTAHMPCRCDIS